VGWIVRVAPNATTISPDDAAVYAFDVEGRPLSWYEGGRVFKRSLGSEVHGRVRTGGRRQRWRADRDEAARLFSALLHRVAEAPRAELDLAGRERLDGILEWTPERLLAEERRFAAAYRPISILPPDQYLAVVLQATFGCTWNRCTFCSFYQDRAFAVRPTAEFHEHARAVAELLGRAAPLRRTIFLADGNALTLSTPRLEPLFEIARATFPGRPLHGFVDVFGGERKSVVEWRALRQAGLRRVYVGVETGHDPLLRWMNKPGGADESVEFVAALKDADLAVSPILMCGAGGGRFAAAHVADSLRWAARAPLGERDVIYLSPFEEHADSEYARRAREDGVRPLSATEIDEQYARLRDGIRGLCRARVARYELSEFLY